jgi:hypothetical protein
LLIGHLNNVFKIIKEQHSSRSFQWLFRNFNTLASNDNNMLMIQEPRRRHPWQHLWQARNDACFCPFCLNLTSFPTFLTLQDKHNIRTLLLNYEIL